MTRTRVFPSSSKNDSKVPSPSTNARTIELENLFRGYEETPEEIKKRMKREKGKRAVNIARMTKKKIDGTVLKIVKPALVGFHLSHKFMKSLFIQVQKCYLPPGHMPRKFSDKYIANFLTRNFGKNFRNKFPLGNVVLKITILMMESSMMEAFDEMLMFIITTKNGPVTRFVEYFDEISILTKDVLNPETVEDETPEIDISSSDNEESNEQNASEPEVQEKEVSEKPKCECKCHLKPETMKFDDLVTDSDLEEMSDFFQAFLTESELYAFNKLQDLNRQVQAAKAAQNAEKTVQDDIKNETKRNIQDGDNCETAKNDESRHSNVDDSSLLSFELSYENEEELTVNENDEPYSPVISEPLPLANRAIERLSIRKLEDELNISSYSMKESELNDDIDENKFLDSDAEDIGVENEKIQIVDENSDRCSEKETVEEKTLPPHNMNENELNDDSDDSNNETEDIEVENEEIRTIDEKSNICPEKKIIEEKTLPTQLQVEVATEFIDSDIEIVNVIIKNPVIDILDVNLDPDIEIVYCTTHLKKEYEEGQGKIQAPFAGGHVKLETDDEVAHIMINEASSNDGQIRDASFSSPEPMDIDDGDETFVEDGEVIEMEQPENIANVKNNNWRNDCYALASCAFEMDVFRYPEITISDNGQEESFKLVSKKSFPKMDLNISLASTVSLLHDVQNGYGDDFSCSSRNSSRLTPNSFMNSPRSSINMNMSPKEEVKKEVEVRDEEDEVDMIDLEDEFSIDQKGEVEVIDLDDEP